MSFSSSTVKISAGICGALFLGYCVYFDRKRRNHPDFRNKLKEKRQKAKTAQEMANKIDLPDFKDPEAMQKFFMKQITIGEELLALGDFENGIEHLSMAVAVCSQQKQILKVLEQTLPPNIFLILMEKIPKAQKKIVEKMGVTSSLIISEDVD